MNGDQWRSSDFTSLVNKDYWIAPTFCNSVHFSISSKYIHLNCEKEMHDAWWSYIEITKPKTIVVVELTLKTSRPKFSKQFIYLLKVHDFISLNIELI
jgi:hypothetical protein